MLFRTINPVYSEVVNGDPSTTGRLERDAKAYLAKHPNLPGYCCFVPAYGGEIMITECVTR